jgi:hypothetical protein
MNNSTPYQRLLARREIPGKEIRLYERYNALQENEDVKYLLGSMEAMDSGYTKTTLEVAESIHKYLEPFSEIRLQGSVTTDTHIRYYSDVDILTISRDFVAWEGSMPSTLKVYAGDATEGLKELRKKSQTTIQAEFPTVRIQEKDRALALSGGSLRRKVDVVSANWFNTNAYVLSQKERERGIEILDVSTHDRVLNKPFLHQAHLIEKNSRTKEGQNRAIRLLKTLKVDAAAKIDISSYDICSLVWNISDGELPGSEDQAFILANNIAIWLNRWIGHPHLLRSLMVPNQTRCILDRNEGTTHEAVSALAYELTKLLDRIKLAGRKIDRRIRKEENILYEL